MKNKLKNRIYEQQIIKANNIASAYKKLRLKLKMKNLKQNPYGKTKIIPQSYKIYFQSCKRKRK